MSAIDRPATSSLSAAVGRLLFGLAARLIRSISSRPITAVMVFRHAVLGLYCESQRNPDLKAAIGPPTSNESQEICPRCDFMLYEPYPAVCVFGASPPNFRSE
jgi:hypothetical protein